MKDKATEVMRSKASVVAGAVRRKATCLGLEPGARADADACADYLVDKAPYLDYANALQKGWPIATGVIEGACRYLVADRLDITGARWGLEGAEAVLKLRALRSNGDFSSYWAYHLAQERPCPPVTLCQRRYSPSRLMSLQEIYTPWGRPSPGGGRPRRRWRQQEPGRSG